MNKSAFTLIEVLVSIVILSSVAVVLFEISSNSKHNFSFLSSKAKFTNLASIALMHGEQKYNNSDKSLYEYIREKYFIHDDEIRRYLKEQKIHLDYKEQYASFSPLGDENQTQNFDNADENGMMNFTILFDKITVSKNNDSTYAYKIYIK